MIGLTKKQVHEMMRRMLLIRRFEESVEADCLNGVVSGGAHLAIGEEALIVGTCMALRKDDYMAGTHRSHGHPIAKGSDVKRLYAEYYGKATGVDGGRGGSMHLADFSVGSLGETSVVGANIPVAAGAALSIKRRGLDQVALTFFGDGAACEGVFHESLNMASLWRLPVIFVCENNGYHITSSAHKSIAAENIADIAKGYNMPSVIVDGQDVIACYQAARDAVGRARNGLGPTLIEGKTYRFRNHSVGKVFDSIQKTYEEYIGRTEEETEYWNVNRDPIMLFRQKLIYSELMTEEEYAEMDSAVKEEVAAAKKFAEDSPKPVPEDAMGDVFKE